MAANDHPEHLILLQNLSTVYEFSSLTNTIEGEIPPVPSSAARSWFDVSGDLTVTPFDALLVINYLQRQYEGMASQGAGSDADLHDVNRDGLVGRVVVFIPTRD